MIGGCGSVPANFDGPIARISVLAHRQPDVSSLVIKPVVAHPDGVDVLGVEIVVAPATKRTDAGRRALT